MVTLPWLFLFLPILYKLTQVNFLQRVAYLLINSTFGTMIANYSLTVPITMVSLMNRLGMPIIKTNSMLSIRETIYKGMTRMSK